MSHWDRNVFATSVEELEIEEAIRAMERLLSSPLIANSTRVSLRLALDVLRADAGS